MTAKKISIQICETEQTSDFETLAVCKYKMFNPVAKTQFFAKIYETEKQTKKEINKLIKKFVSKNQYTEHFFKETNQKKITCISLFFDLKCVSENESCFVNLSFIDKQYKEFEYSLILHFTGWIFE